MSLPERKAVPEAHQWDLTSLYASASEWTEEFAHFENAAHEVSAFRSTLKESAQKTGEAFRCCLELSRVAERLYTYAHLLSDSDTSDPEHQACLEKATNVYTRFATLSSFLVPELLSLDEETLARYLRAPELSALRRMLADIMRYKPHTLSAEEERLIASATEIFGASGRIFSQLSNADLAFPEIEVDGEKKSLSHASFVLFLKNHDRSVRERAFNEYYRVYDQHRNTIAAALAGSVKKDVFLAQTRRYDSALTQALFADNIAPAVYDNLLAAVSRNLEPLHRYYELRRKRLGLNKLRIYDTYVPLVPEVSIRHTYEEAVLLAAEALQPLGPEYVDVLVQGLTHQRWVDRYENKGKRSGAYSSGCFDSYPYILLNYKEDDIGSVFTLLHEAGHSMHSWYSQRSQKFQDYRYSIFVAEVASTFNEQLLMRRLKEKYAGDRKMLAFLVNEQLDDIKATFYRQVMFAEFEKIIHDLAENNKPLTVAVFREVYRELLYKYFGPAVELGEWDDLECLRIPHFYSAFYVYKYATGLAAAISLAAQVMSGDTEPRRRYLDFLKAGASKYPAELLADAGVRITEPAPIEAAVTLFGSLVDELEELTV